MLCVLDIGKAALNRVRARVGLQKAPVKSIEQGPWRACDRATPSRG